jgi:hypothetical protein
MRGVSRSGERCEGKSVELAGSVNDAADRKCPHSGNLDGDANGLQPAGHGSSSDSTERLLNDVLQPSTHQGPL